MSKIDQTGTNTHLTLAMARIAGDPRLLRAPPKFDREFAPGHARVACANGLNPGKMKLNKKRRFSARSFLASAGTGRSVKHHATGEAIFTQSDAADALFYVRRGRVKVTVASNRGKQAVIAILGSGDFFGEGCLAGQPVRMSSAAAMSECSLMRLEKAAAIAVIHKEPGFSELFLSYVLSRNIRIEEDLIDQLFSSSEKRLARVLLLLANFGKEGKPETVIPKMSQKTLAEIVGTTRSRVSFFMNRFRKKGFIDYKKGLEVHSSLLNVVLRD